MSSHRKSYRKDQFQAVQQEGLELFRRKNEDYGDAFADYGVVGVLVRMGDKIRRLQSITRSGVTLVSDESLRDTLIDLHNYAAMGVLLMDERDALAQNASPQTASTQTTRRIVHKWWGEGYEKVEYDDGEVEYTLLSPDE